MCLTYFNVRPLLEKKRRKAKQEINYTLQHAARMALTPQTHSGEFKTQLFKQSSCMKAPVLKSAFLPLMSIKINYNA